MQANPDSAQPGSAATPPAAGRRSFVKQAAAAAMGAVLGLGPLCVGLFAFLDPLRRRGQTHFLPIAPLHAVPDDGLPRMFPVVAERRDAWNRYPRQPIGAVYIVRQPGESEPAVFTATCPHAGCFVGYTPGDDKFQCPCHTSAFHLDGTRIGGDQSVSPRNMDRLEAELQGGAEGQTIWVKFQRFQTGQHDQVAIG